MYLTVEDWQGHFWSNCLSSLLSAAADYIDNQPMEYLPWVIFSGPSAVGTFSFFRSKPTHLVVWPYGRKGLGCYSVDQGEIVGIRWSSAEVEAGPCSRGKQHLDEVRNPRQC